MNWERRKNKRKGLGRRGEEKERRKICN
jgi:hypothetical protein